MSVIDQIKVIDSQTEDETIYDLAASANNIAYDNTTTVKDKIDSAFVELSNKIDVSEKGVANGVATLNNHGTINTEQLPSYVDDVIEFNSEADFPNPGTSGIIYVSILTSLTYRQSGTTYVEISPSVALGTTHETAYYGDLGKTAYDHSRVISGNPHHVTKEDLGIILVGEQNTTGLIKNGSSVTDITGYVAVPIVNGVPYYKGATVVANPIDASTAELNKLKIEDTIYDVVSNTELNTAVTTLQTNFQAGVDSVYNACVDKGSTPISHSLTDVIDAIENIKGGNGGQANAKKQITPYSFDYNDYGPTTIPANTGKEYIIFCYVTYRGGGGNPSCTITNGTLTLLASHGSDGSYSLPYKVYHFVKINESAASTISYTDIDSAFWLPIPNDILISEVTAENSLDLATETYAYNYTTDYCLVIYHLRDNGRHTEPKGMTLRMLESPDMHELVAQSAEDATYSVQEQPTQAFIFSNDGSNILNISSMYKNSSTQRRNLIFIPLGSRHKNNGVGSTMIAPAVGYVIPVTSYTPE